MNKMHRNNQHRTQLKIFLPVSIFLLASILFIATVFTNGQEKYHQYEISSTVVFVNTSKVAIQPEYLIVQIPVSDNMQQTEFQLLSPLFLQYRIIGNAILFKNIPAVNPQKKLSVEYKCRTKIYDTKNRILAPPQTTDLSPEPDIESTDPGIIKKARELIVNINTEEEKVRALYHFVALSISYNVSVANNTAGRSAKDCLTHAGGVCGHKANLLTALCRASGLYARTQTGLTLPTFPFFNSHGLMSHAWTEIYIRNKGWIFADPTFGNNIISKYQYLGKEDQKRLAFETNGHRTIKHLIDSINVADCVMACEMTGPCYVHLAIRGHKNPGLYIDGELLKNKITQVY